MSRHEEIQDAYKSLGGEATFYDGMITCSTLPGKAVCRLVWNMGKKQNDRYLERAQENVKFVQGDVGRLPFPDESFDIVLSLNGFHAFPDKEAAYHETYRVLKKGGVFCGCFYIKGQNRRTDWFANKLYTPKGFFTPPYETLDSLRSLAEMNLGHTATIIGYPLLAAILSGICLLF